MRVVLVRMDTACLMIAAGSSWLVGGGGSFISPLEQSELVICQCDVVITKHMAWHHDKAQDCQTFGSLPNWAFSLTSEFLAQLPISTSGCPGRITALA